MKKAATFVLVLLAGLSTYSWAQGPCPTFNSTTRPISKRSGDLICVLPQVYGPSGLVGDNDNGPLVNTAIMSATSHDVDFQNSTFVTLPSLTSEIGAQLSQLPLASPVSGLLFTFHEGVMSEITQNFGPVLSERGQTIGRHKLFVGVSYQYFNFDKIDGVDLRNFGAVFTHELTGLPSCPSGPTCANGLPLFAQDVITTQNRLDLKIHEVAAVAAFGLTNRWDVSVAVPILDVRMSMVSTATIHSFETYAKNIDGSSCFDDPIAMAGGPTIGCMHQFSTNTVQGETLLPPSPYPFLQNQARFSTGNSAFGIGDVLFRTKYQAIKGERTSLAVGLDVHAPTGDEMNFLGSGTWGTRPFVAFSYARRLAPHASFGYQINGNSILSGDVTRDVKGHLPNVLTYDAGADFAVNRRLTLSGDFLGQALHNQKTISQTMFVDFAGVPHPSILASTQTSNQASVAAGGKIRPYGRLLVTANVLFRVNDAGLHTKPVPLVGVSYTF